MPSERQRRLTLVLAALFLAFCVLQGCECDSDEDQSLGGDGEGVNPDLDDDTDDVLPPPPPDDDDDDTGDDDNVIVIPEEGASLLINALGMDPVPDGDDNAVPDDQAGVPGDQLPYRAELFLPDGQSEIPSDIVWSVSDESLATINDNGWVTLLDYGLVVVTGTVTRQNVIDEEVAIFDSANIYVQADILVLDRNSGRLGSVDYALDEVEIDIFSAEPFDIEAADMVVAGHDVFVAGESGAGAKLVRANLDVANLEIASEFILLDNARAVNLEKTKDSILIAIPERQIVPGIVNGWLPLFTIVSNSSVGGLLMPEDSSPFGLTYDKKRETVYVTLTFPEGDGYQEEGMAVMIDTSYYVTTIWWQTCSNPRYVAPMEVSGSQHRYVICAGIYDNTAELTLPADDEDGVDSGLDVEAGYYINVTATGDIKLADDGEDLTPDGINQACGNDACPLREANWGALLATIKSGNKANDCTFTVGESFRGAAPCAGNLRFLVNDFENEDEDNTYADNTGSFDITVTVNDGGDVDVFKSFDTIPDATISLGLEPEAFAVAGTLLFIGDKAAPNLYLIDGASETDEAVNGSDNPILLPSGGAVQALYYDPTRLVLYVANDEGRLFIYDVLGEEFMATSYDFGDFDISAVTSW